MKHKLKLRQAEIKDERENNAERDKSRLLVKANHMSDSFGELQAYALHLQQQRRRSN